MTARLVALLALCALRPAAAQSLMEQAKAAQQRGRLDSAYTIIQLAAEAEPDNAAVQYALGDIAGSRAGQVGGLRAYGIARKCKQGYARAVALEPTNPNYLEGLIGYLSQAPGIVGGDRDSALVLAAALRRIDEWRGTSAMVGALLRGNAREKARADSVMDAYGRAHPGDRLAMVRVAGFFGGSERPERALPLYESALAHDSTDVVARFGVARNLVVLKRDPGRALGYLHYVAARPRPTGDNVPSYSAVGLWWRMGQAFVQLGMPDSARIAYTHALQVQPGFAGAQRSLDSLSHP